LVILKEEEVKFDDIGVDGRIILKLTLKEYVWEGVD
jgi:hypothetical protein